MRVARGFTLIELMVVVAIIGLLASVAGPSMRDFMVRARASELKVVHSGIKVAVQNAVIRDNFFWPGGGLWFALPFNPSLDDGSPASDPSSLPSLGAGPGQCQVGPAKPWDTSSALQTGWKWIDYVPEGNLRGRYSFTHYGWVGVEPLHFNVWRASDLDGDGYGAARITSYVMGESGSWTEEYDVILGTGGAPADEGTY